MEYCFYFDWKGLTSTEWAAWVQAIGSVGAIIAAILIARFQHTEERRTRQAESDARSRSRALSLLPRLQTYEATLRQSRFEIEMIGVTSWPNLLEAIKLPDGLAALATDAHELGTAATPFQRVVLTSNNTTQKILEVLDANDSGVDGPAMESLENIAISALSTAAEAADKAIDVIDAMFLERPPQRTDSQAC